MKVFSAVVALWATAIAGVITAESASRASATALHHARREAPATFGPAGCVSIAHSSTGTCVLSTTCDGHDLSNVEFAFDCEAAEGGDIVRHSFGFGGFDINEDFDTEVKCHTCSLPTPNVAAQPIQEQIQENAQDELPKQVHEQAQKQSATSLRLRRRTVEQQAESRYGPNGCVSTYRSADGHCMIATDCKSVDIENYEFGLVCVDKAGSPVRHLFGKNSFDPQETFDTLIACDRCLGLDDNDIPGDVALVGKLDALTKEVGDLKGIALNLTTDVTKLKSAVFKDGSQSDKDLLTHAETCPESCQHGCWSWTDDEHSQGVCDRPAHDVNPAVWDAGGAFYFCGARMPCSTDGRVIPPMTCSATADCPYRFVCSEGVCHSEHYSYHYYYTPDFCAADCPSAWIGDGYCDFPCLNEDCNFDDGDCGSGSGSGFGSGSGSGFGSGSGSGSGFGSGFQDASTVGFSATATSDSHDETIREPRHKARHLRASNRAAASRHQTHGHEQNLRYFARRSPQRHRRGRAQMAAEDGEEFEGAEEDQQQDERFVPEDIEYESNRNTQDEDDEDSNW